MKHVLPAATLLTLVCCGALSSPALSAEGVQDDESKALDSTATQWSFQVAYQWMDYKSDILDNGQTRQAGLDNYAQLRVVAPVPLQSLTILPRVTIRHYENLNTGATGFGNTEVFALMVPKGWDWGTGRVGVGPLFTLPGSKKVSRDEWGYGFAAGAVNTRGRWFYGLLITQSWRAIDPEALPAGSSDTNPLGIAPFLNFRLGNGWYVGNGDMVALWDWNSSEFYLPIAIRLGRVLVRENGTWNFYGEYRTSVIYEDYPGPAVDNSYRLNVAYTIPVKFGK